MTDDLTRGADPTFRVLGALSVHVAGDYLPLPSSRPLNMLAALLVSPGVVTSNEFLARAVWGDDTDVDTRAALRTCTTRLRKLLVRHNLGDDLIETVSGGFRLKAGPDELDLQRFRQMVADSVHRPDADGQLAVLRAALALWDGSLLCNVESEVLHRSVVPLLEEERLQALERVVDVLLAGDRQQDALNELQQLTRSYEGHERFAQQLATTLHAVGRREDALAECRRIKGYLDRELGLEPTAQLREVEVAILRGDPAEPRPLDEPVQASGAGGPARATAGTGADADQDSPQLPAADDTVRVLRRPGMATAPSGFVGRRAELDAVTGFLHSADPTSPLVLIGGAFGIGKTSFARALAGAVSRDYPSSALVGLRERDGAHRTPAAVVDELVAGGAMHPALVVLDDAAGPAQVAQILDRLQGGTATLVTATVDITALVRSHGAVIHRLRPLGDADAFGLLSSLVGPHRLAHDLLAAQQLIRSSWGNPLALRMIASVLQTRPQWTVTQCAEWLGEDPVRRLSGPATGATNLVQLYDEAAARLGDAVVAAARNLAGLTDDASENAATFDHDDARRLLARDLDDILCPLIAAGWLDEVAPGRFGFDPMIRACLQLGVRDDRAARNLNHHNVFAMTPVESTKEGA